MTDIELKLSADVSGATKNIGTFRKEYQELVRVVEKPLRQIDVFQKTQEDAIAASKAYFAARKNVDSLKSAIEQAGAPVRDLERAYDKAQRTLSLATREFDRQKAKVREQRAELKAAGVDTKNLATEQQRLRAALSGAAGKGKADAEITASLERFNIDKLRSLRTQLQSLDVDYRRLMSSGVLSARERMAAEIQYQASVNKTKAAIKELETDSEGVGANIRDMAARLAGLVAAGYAVERASSAFFDIADGIVTMEDRLRGAVATQDEYDRSLAKLEDTSRRVRIPLGQTSELFIGMAGPLREMGFSAGTTANMVAALAAGLVTSNVKGQQAEATIQQINKGLQTGVIRGDAFNAMLQNSPTLINALTEGLKVSRAELIRMANAGELTTEKFVASLGAQSEALLGLADGMRSTVGDARGTLGDSIEQVVGAIDKLTGASDLAVKKLDDLSDALNKSAKGDGSGIAGFLADRTSWTFFNGFNLWIDAYESLTGAAEESSEAIIDAEQKAAEEVAAINEESLAAKRAYAADFTAITEDLTIRFKKALEDQVAAQRKANSELSKARNAQLETEKRYKDALNKLQVGAGGTASYGRAQALQVAARQALSNGDVDAAKRNAQAALDVLLKLAEAGENTYGFDGMIRGLQQIEEQADQIGVDKATKSFEEAREKTRVWKEELKELQDFKITPNISDEALAKEAEKLRNWAKTIGLDISFAPRTLPDGKLAGSAIGAGINPPQKSQIIKPEPVVIKPVGVAKISAEPLPVVDVTPRWVREGNSFSDAPVDVAARPRWVRDGNSFSDVPPVDVAIGVDQESVNATSKAVDAIAQDLERKLSLSVSLSVPSVTAAGGDQIPGYATGGYLRGAGSGTSDSMMIRASNGEYMLKAAAVRHYGVNMLDQLNAMRIPKFATGGLISNQSVPSIPTISPSLMAGPSFPDLGSLTISLGGQEVNVYASQDDALNLKRLAAKFGRS